MVHCALGRGGGAVIALNGQEGRRVDPEDPPLPCPQTQDKMGAGDLEFIDTNSLLHDGMRKLEMEQDPKSLPSPIISSACLLSVENFSQRISLIREVRSVGTKENSQRGLNDNNVATKHRPALEKEMAPPPAFLPGESQGRGSLVGCRLWGRTESDTTERLSSSSSSIQ